MSLPMMPQGQTPPPPRTTGPSPTAPQVAPAGMSAPPPSGASLAMGRVDPSALAAIARMSAAQSAPAAPAGPSPAQLAAQAAARRQALGAAVGPRRAKGGTIKKAKGGAVKKMAKGGSVSSASKRGDGCATKGKTKGRFV